MSHYLEIALPAVILVSFELFLCSFILAYLGWLAAFSFVKDRNTNFLKAKLGLQITENTHVTARIGVNFCLILNIKNVLCHIAGCQH